MKTETYASQLVEWLIDHGTEDEEGFLFCMVNEEGQEVSDF